MKKLIASLLILSFLPLQGLAALTNTDRAEFTGRNLLADKNPGAENGKTGWTLSAGSFTASTSSPLEGGASFVWDATAASQTFTGTAVTIPEGWKGQNGVVSCRFQCASGTCTHTLTAWDGTNNVINPVAITSATTGAPRTTANFIFPTSGTITARVTSSADEPSLKIDSCIVGLANDINLSQVNQSSLVGTAYIANTGSCQWTRTNSVLGEVSTTAACPGPTVEVNPGPGTIQTTDTDLPRFTVNSLPPGTYWVSMDGTGFIATSAQEGAVAINDGSTTFGQTGMEWSTTGGHFHAEGAVTYSSTANVTFKLFISSAANAITVANNGNNEQVHFSIMRFPSTAELVYNTGKQVTSTTTVLNSGTAQTYTTPTGATELEVYAWGGGGGGGASGTTAGGTPGAATATTFGTSLLTAGFGVGGVNDGAGGAGGAPTVTAPALDAGSQNGSQGGASNRIGGSPVTPFPGGHGGGPGGGAGGYPGGTGAGQVAAANTGGGGGGGYCPASANCISGSGGGAGAFVHATIPNPAPTYTYTVGAAGTGGTLGAGGAAGGNGSAGKIVVVVRYSTTQMPVLVGGFRGTQTNDSAPTGYAGEYVSSSNSTAANFPSSGNWGDATSISLTAGDWDVSFCLGVNLNSATLTNSTYEMGISTTTGNSSSGLAYPDNIIDVAAGTSNSFTYGSCIPAYRVSLSATTTYYGKLRANYTVATVQFNYRLSARRVR